MTDIAAPLKLRAAERAALLSAVCAEGDHGTCLGTVYLWPPPVDGATLGRCECPECNHEAAHTRD